MFRRFAPVGSFISSPESSAILAIYAGRTPSRVTLEAAKTQHEFDGSEYEYPEPPAHVAGYVVIPEAAWQTPPVPKEKK